MALHQPWTGADATRSRAQLRLALNHGPRDVAAAVRPWPLSAGAPDRWLFQAMALHSRPCHGICWTKDR